MDSLMVILLRLLIPSHADRAAAPHLFGPVRRTHCRYPMTRPEYSVHSVAAVNRAPGARPADRV